MDKIQKTLGEQIEWKLGAIACLQGEIDAGREILRRLAILESIGIKDEMELTEWRQGGS
jgi:hypothetical protein